MSEDQYFATLEGEELCEELNSRIDKFRRDVSSSFQDWRIDKSFYQYYGITNNANSSEITAGGRLGELRNININLYRYLIQRTASSLAGRKFSYVAIPNNLRAPTLRDARRAQNLFENYVNILDMHQHMLKIVEYGLACTAGFSEVVWDPTAGEEVWDGEKTGDVVLRAYNIYDVVEGPRTSDPDMRRWYILRRFENKYDVAARYPELADEIVQLTYNPMNDNWVIFNDITLRDSQVNEDMIPVYTFYHQKTPAVPSGRKVEFLTDSIWLDDNTLDTDRIPVFTWAPSHIEGTDAHYSPMLDLLGPLSAFNHILSIILTNQYALGTNRILSRAGNKVTEFDLSKQLSVIEYAMEKPEVLTLGNTSPQLFDTTAMLQQLVILLSGQNETSLGVNPQRLSGDALNILNQQAITFAAPMFAALEKHAKNLANQVLQTFKLYAKAERQLAVLEGGRYVSEQVSADSFAYIQEITIESVDPAFQTLDYRRREAKELLAAGLITEPESYLAFLETGNTKIFTGASKAEFDLVADENELLLKGEVPPVLPSDRHTFHIQKHNAALNDIHVRMDDTARGAIEAHVALHNEALMYADPTMLAATGQNMANIQQQSSAMARANVDPMAGTLEDEQMSGTEDVQAAQDQNVG